MSSSRSLVSDDDISGPYQARAGGSSPPAKKYRPNPDSTVETSEPHLDPSQPGKTDKLDETREEIEKKIHTSRELAHEEIWDDLALVNAWNAATEEYELCHSKDKSSKTRPLIQKSPLWYTIPYAPSEPALELAPDPEPEALATDEHMDQDAETNSIPIDFNTFVPTHDPGLLTSPTGAATDTTVHSLPSLGPIVGHDEAFQNALGAMYWTGYWTAMYHTKEKRKESVEE